MYFIFKKSNPGFYLLHLGRKQVIILTRKIKMRKMTQQFIKSMMGSVEVNITSNQDKTLLAVDSDSDLVEKWLQFDLPSVFGLPRDRLRVQVPHDWDRLHIRAGRGIFLLALSSRLSPHHSHLLAGVVGGENSETEGGREGPTQARHQDGQHRAHGGGGLGRAGHEEGEGDVLYPAQYEALGVVGGDVEPHLGPGEEQGGLPGAQPGLVTEHCHSSRCSEQQPQPHPVFAPLSHRPVPVPAEVRQWQGAPGARAKVEASEVSREGLLPAVLCGDVEPARDGLSGGRPH